MFHTLIKGFNGIDPTALIVRGLLGNWLTFYVNNSIACVFEILHFPCVYNAQIARCMCICLCEQCDRSMLAPEHLSND